jgi:hypothetical protein
MLFRDETAKLGLWSRVMNMAEYIDISILVLQLIGVSGIAGIAAIGWYEWWGGHMR